MAQGPGDQGQGEGGIEAVGRCAFLPEPSIEFVLVDTDAPHAPGTRLRLWRRRSVVMSRHFRNHIMRPAAVVVLILAAGCRDQSATDSSSEVAASPPGAPESATTKPTSPTQESRRAAPADPCAGPQTILVDELEAERARIVETRLSGERLRTILEPDVPARPAIDLLGQRAFGPDGFTDLRSGETRPIAGAMDLVSPAFVGTQPWVVSELRSLRLAAPQPRIRVLDYVSGQTVTTFDGYSPSVAPDDSILFLQPSESHADIMRWNGKDPVLVKRIELSPNGPYAVTEVVSVSRDRFVHRIYDEHEHRYYDNQDAPFFAGSDEDTPKEQFDLVVSADGRHAAFTERNWNELTYLVVIDLVEQRRIATRFYGSFPAIYGEYVAFVSDPAFVRGGDLAFRQVSEFAVYAYHVPTGTLCDIATYPGVAQPH
jgi:hypothetical protein